VTTCIVAATARPLDVPMTKAFGIAGGAQEIARNVLVTLELAGGVRGYGEAAPFPAFNGETQERALADLARVLPDFIGRDVRDFRGRVECDASASALCAIETAIVDAQARAEGRSLRAFFGGAEEVLVSDVTIVTGTVEDAVRDASAFREFRTLKIKVGGHDLDRDVARVLAVHAVRPDAELLLDANGGFTLDEAIRLAAELAHAGVRPALFEQPIAAGDWGALAEVRQKTGLRIAIDESVSRVSDVAEAVRHRAADAVNVKIMKSGIFEAAAIARAAAAAGLDRMIGGMVETRLAMGTSACIAAGLGGFRIVDLDTPLFLAADPFEGGYRYEGDRVDLRPIALGHGCVPNLKQP
jgi:L-alanine-DL-glutamate epimerase-like enolase superfamily enzyme